MENEKQKELLKSSSKTKKNNLVIDYSKFQNNFLKNLKQEDNRKNIGIEEKDNIINQTQRNNNYDQFLNVSEILNEDMSRSSLIDLENQKSKAEDNKIKDKKTNHKINKSILNNNSDNFSMGESDEPNLLISNNELILSYNGSNPKKKQEKIKNTEFNHTTLNSYKKKKNYVKFINKHNFESDLCKTSDKEKTSYAKIIEKNRLLKEKNYKSKYLVKADKFNLLKEINSNYNNSVLTISDISIVPSTTTTVDFITGNNSNNISIKSYYNNKVNRIKTIQNMNNYSNKIIKNKNKNNKRNNSNENTYHSVNELNIKNNNNNNKKRKTSYEKQKNLMLYVNKAKINENQNKNDDLIYLLDNIKTKYKNQENKFMNQQKYMEDEIEILKEKVKTLSVNEALYQVEIEKLKRKNNNEPNNSNINNTLINSKDKSINNTNSLSSENKIFEQKLDDIVKKYNKDYNNNNVHSLPKKQKNTQFEQLLDYFNLDKDLFSGENIILENEESFNYEKAFNEYPQIKKFIEILVEKYKNEKDYRTRLEEKTVEIFTNDMRTINTLEQKIKKCEEKSKQFKNNAISNLSLEAGLSDNVNKNSHKSFKSCDK